MLDHVFTDAIDALTQSLEKALLERLGVDEHLTSDMLSGDMSFETSYGLLGEESPPRVRADISLVWPPSSQVAFRDWYLDEGPGDRPQIELELTLRVQRLATPPDVPLLLAATPPTGPTLGETTLFRGGPTIEQSYGRELTDASSAFEIAYQGTYELDEHALADSSQIDVAFGALGGWIAAALVRLNDLDLTYGPLND